MARHNLLRRYAQVAGVGLVLLGMSGVVLNLPDSPLVLASFHLLTGFVLVSMGLSSRCRIQYCRATVAGSGLLFLMIGMIDPAIALLDSAPLSSYEGTEEAWFGMGLGLLSLSIAALAAEDDLLC